MRRLSLFRLAALIVFASMGIFASGVQADDEGCQPNPGPGSTDSIAVICNGDDFDGVNVGSGNDSVDILTGTVYSTITSEGGTLNIVIFGAMNTIAAGVDAVVGTGPLDLGLYGIVYSGGDVVVIKGNGTIKSDGGYYSSFGGGLIILADGDNNSGHINHIGDIYVQGLNQPQLYGTYGYGLSVDQGSIFNIGNVTSTRSSAIHIEDGTVNTTGNLYADGFGVVMESGDIISIGDVTIDGSYHDGSSGFRIYTDGTLNTTGRISGGYSGIHIGGEGTVTSTGDISSYYFGIVMEKKGDLVTVGNITSAAHAIYLYADGKIESIGDLYAATGYGIFVGGDAEIVSVGDIYGGTRGISVGGGGTIDTTGAITSNYEGVYLEGDGQINMQGSVEAGATGIEGGAGDQVVIVAGSVEAPVAVRLNDGNDTLIFQSNANVQGVVSLGDGDDTVVIANHAVVTDTMFGGEGAEVNGNSLIIGSGQVCSEDAQAAAAAFADAQALGTLNPDSGTVTYLGETYTWVEFEHIVNGSSVSPCTARINDGRANSLDLGAPNAVYCTVGGGISVWQIDLTGKGTFSFAVTAEQIAAAFEQATASGVNQQIAADSLGNILYALSDEHTITFVGHDLREPDKQYMTTMERTLCA